MAGKGASLVVAQHTHCVGCYERYHDSTLIYGQGNFIFGKYGNEFWDSSLLLKINASKNDFSVEFIPISKNGDEKQVMADFEKRSLRMQDEGFIESEYKMQINTNILREYIKLYKTGFQELRLGTDNEIYKWKAIKCFQDNWKIEAESFPAMVEAALAQTFNLLGSQNNFSSVDYNCLCISALL